MLPDYIVGQGRVSISALCKMLSGVRELTDDDLAEPNCLSCQEIRLMTDDSSQDACGPEPARQPQSPPTRRSYLIPIAVAIGCLPWLILGMLFVALLLSLGGDQEGRPHVALIRVTGVITASESASSVFEGVITGSESVVEQLEKARKNKAAKAVVIRIDSPGGSPAGAEEVYNEISRVRKDGKPVYTSMADVAASAGYYIASASDQIHADASTLTGSIGVIWDIADMSGLYRKIGYNSQIVKSGKFKDIGSPSRPLTAEERALLQAIVDDSFNHFVRAVAKGRSIPEGRLRNIADGRILTGSQAVKLGLVDKLGGLRETTLAAARAGGMKGEPKVVEYEERRWLDVLFGGRASITRGRGLR